MVGSEFSECKRTHIHNFRWGSIYLVEAKRLKEQQCTSNAYLVPGTRRFLGGVCQPYARNWRSFSW